MGSKPLTPLTPSEAQPALREQRPLPVPTMQHMPQELPLWEASAKPATKTLQGAVECRRFP